MTNVAPSKLGSWLGTNWKWVLPVGCLGTIALMVGFFFIIFSIVNGAIKSSWAYTEGMALASRHPEVVRDLGEPITSGWLVTGSINRSGSSGDADLSIPLRGPEGRGTLYVVAERRAGKWSFELAEVGLDGDSVTIDLLEGP